MSEIEIRDVSKVFDTDEGKVQALSHVNINIEKGDIFGIIGMSGAGKSTL
ncbi:MAG TPA: ABC transporter, partial [Erysipelotrichaceae bacterium]|nr:ABC transporter [Erysipelotrichaceae bacterium]